MNVTFLPFCYFPGKYFLSISSAEIEAEKQKTCWKQSVIIFFICITVFLWPNQVCDGFGIWVYTAERGFGGKKIYCA